MGKIKKVASNDKKVKKTNKSLKAVKRSKIVKNDRTKLGAVLSTSKKTLRNVNNVDVNLTKLNKSDKTNLDPQNKLQKIKPRSIVQAIEVNNVAKNDAESRTGKTTAKLNKKPADNEEVDVNMVSSNKLGKHKKSGLEKVKEDKVKKTLKSKTQPFKVKTALIFNQKPPKTESSKNTSINIQEGTVKSGIKALFRLIEVAKSDKNLFEDEVPIFLHFCTVKIAKTASRTVRFHLKHSLLKDSSEVCLITDDIPGHPKKEFEKTVDHYENLLREKGVMNIKKIMPLYQLKTEYSEFELKRKLVELYDMFLVDGKVSKYAAKSLGKIFMEKRKLPIPVHMDATNLKEHLKLAMRKTSLNLHPHGDNFVIQIAHSDMTEDQIYENFEETCANLGKLLPGGWENIRGMNLKTPKSMAVPVYYTLKNPSGLPIPVAKPKRSKAYKRVSGELSTAYDRQVEVLPSGEVKLKKSPLKRKNTKEGKNETTNGISMDEANESDEEYERLYKQVEKSNKVVKSPNAQLKAKISKKQSSKMKAKQQRNRKSKGFKKSQAVSKKMKVKTKMPISNKEKKNKINIKKNKK